METVISPAGDGKLFAMGPGNLLRYKVLTGETGGVFECFEREVPPHTVGADAHLHRNSIETFYVVSGTATVLCGDSIADHGPGSMLVIPVNIVHAFANRSDEPMKVLISFHPGWNHHTYFQELVRLKHGPQETYQRDLDALRLKYDSISVPRDFPA